MENDQKLKQKNGHNSVPRATQGLRTCMQVATGCGQAWGGFPGPGGVRKPLFLMIFEIFSDLSGRDFFIHV